MPEKKMLVSRRDALRILSGVGLTFLSSRWLPAATPVATLSPELTSGPFYLDLERVRRDITEGKPGVPLRLKFRVTNVNGAPVAGAAIDVWHCDAQGVYSGYASDAEAPHFDGPPPGAQGPGDHPFDGKFPSGPPPQRKPDNADTFLRGVQITDARGMAEIDTIYPGWYAGRATHIHVRVHAGGKIAGNHYEGGHISHTGQIFLPEKITAEVDRLPAYAKPDSPPRLALNDDGIFRQGGHLITPVKGNDPARPLAGLIAEPVLVVDPAATPPDFSPFPV